MPSDEGPRVLLTLVPAASSCEKGKPDTDSNHEADHQPGGQTNQERHQYLRSWGSNLVMLTGLYLKVTASPALYANVCFSQFTSSRFG
jgi:hypothetical protein